MTDTTVTVTDPAAMITKRVDNAGRLYLGKDFEGDQVRVVVERVDPDERDESEPDES